MQSCLLDKTSKKLFRPDEVAQMLSVNVRTVYAWRAEGKLEGIKITNKCLRFPRQEVIHFISAKSTA